LTVNFLPRSEVFYINLNNSASSDGIVSSLEYCYFNTPLDDDDVFQTTVAIYRQTNDSGEYSLLPNSTTVLTGNHQTEISINQLVCTSHNLSSRVTVKRGDVLAACQCDFEGNTEPMNLVAQVNSMVDSEGLMSDQTHTFCEGSQQLQQSFNTRDLNPSTRSLLISAIINSAFECVLFIGNNLKI